MDVQAYWDAVLRQDREAMRGHFARDARIRWPNTNEEFTLEEVLTANCDYPGRWAGEVERAEPGAEGPVTVARVYDRDGSASFHAVSFFRERDGKIQSLVEYWGEDGPPPQWRRERELGRPIGTGEA